MSANRFYINTMGCQMNVHDSVQMAAILESQGYTAADSLNQADLIILNTCTIRDKARQKALSFLGRLAVRKKHRPELIIAVGGCVAQQEGEALLKQMPFIDLVFGTQAFPRLPQLLDRVRRQGEPVVAVDLADGLWDSLETVPIRSAALSTFVTIMQGCDNYCTYCVVPYVRGRESSRPEAAILAEIRRLVAAGTREVTLLGQNVNSYGKKEGYDDFARLLAAIEAIPDLARIRFATSHPKDLSPELARSFQRLTKLCNHCHLPVQSGASAVLKRMNRKYTPAQYLEKIDWLKNARADIALSTDIIVGFPGETESDFSKTLDLLQQVEFDAIFAFGYSDRSVAPAAGFSGKISQAAKQARLSEVLRVQKAIGLKKNKAYEGQTVPVLVEGYSKSAPAATDEDGPAGHQYTGRTTTNKVVNFSNQPEGCPTAELTPGAIVQVEIDQGFAHSLLGRAVLVEQQSPRIGGAYYAA